MGKVMRDAMRVACATVCDRRIANAMHVTVRTDERTQTLQDPGDIPQPVDARDAGGAPRQDSPPAAQDPELQAHPLDPETAPLRDTIHSTIEQITHATERLPIERTSKGPRYIDPDVRRMVLLRDGFTCRWCHAHIRDGIRFEIDHIVPWSAGGTNATDNLRTLCETCNQQRSNYRTDAHTTSSLLIVGDCPWCRGRHYVHWWESEDSRGHYVYDETAELEISPSDRTAPIWCIGCRGRSSTSTQHAADVRRRQANRYAPAGYTPAPAEDHAAWRSA